MDEMIFRLSKKQTEKYQKWTKEHNCPYWDDKFGARYVGCGGGADRFVFVPTNLGNIVNVQCCCGAEIDLTEDFG